MKIYKYILGIVLPLVMQSCLFSEDDYFDASSAQRAMASVEECKAVLESASNGWHIEYYTGENAEFGGYNLYAKFEGQKVHVASEMPTNNYQVGDIASSLYKVTSVQSTELSFDSYNELIHKFCEPAGYKAPGYAGDYEFVFMELSKDCIVLKGKKRGNRIVMTPLPADLNWKQSLQAIYDLQVKSPYATYKFKVGEEEITMLRSNHSWTMTTFDEQGEKIVTKYPFIYTDKGIKLLRPMELKGVTVHNMNWDQASRSFICTDEGMNARLEFYCPKDYAKFKGTYYVLGGRFPISASIAQNIEGLDYKITLYTEESLGVDLVIIADYNLETDCIDLVMQDMGVVLIGFNVYLLPWNSDEGFFTWQKGSGLSGYIASKPGEKLKLKFKDNGVWKQANGFTISGFEGNASGANFRGSFLQFANPVFLKLF